MRIWPVFIDARPEYLDAAPERSLLLFPVGTATLLRHLVDLVAPLTKSHPIVLSSCGTTPRLRSAFESSCPGVRLAGGSAEITDWLAEVDSSDTLLLLDSQQIPRRAAELARLTGEHEEDAGTIQHLVASAHGIGAARERVSLDAAGRVRGITRHFEPVASPSIIGVLATRMTVPCALAARLGDVRSLSELRSSLAARGFASRDVRARGGVHDLASSFGLLAASESFIRAAAASRNEAQMDNGPCAAIYVGAGHDVAPTARLIGPVVVHANATIEQHVTIVGPAVIGEGARIGAGATVAQAAVAPCCEIPPGAVVRSRVCCGRSSADRTTEQRLATFREQLVRIDLAEDPPGPPAVRASRRVSELVKRSCDVLVSFVALVCLLPVVAAVAILVWLESGRPVFYGDPREGRNGRTFRCWKFRTMYVGSDLAQRELRALDHTDGPHFKIERDPRVTKIGRFLRTSNLDEIPQLFNVLCGEMSLVGPRPSPFRENQVCVPWRQGRLSVQPGITGLWQVCRHDRENGDFHQWIEYDLLYVQHQSVWLDMKIFAATVATVAGKLGHAPVHWLISDARGPAKATDVPRSSATSESRIDRRMNTAATV